MRRRSRSSAARSQRARGSGATPAATSASTVLARMPMTIAPVNRLREQHADRRSVRRARSTVSGVRRLPCVTGGRTAAGLRERGDRARRTTTSLAFTAPMNAMNSPIPTPIARRRSRGIASITASRSPSEHEREHEQPVEHDQPHGARQPLRRRRHLIRDDRVQPHAGRQRDREFGPDPSGSNRRRPRAPCRRPRR